jgi:very-short-patch-repair endonuclease
MKWTLSHIEKLAAEGKIKSYTITPKKTPMENVEGGRIVARHYEKRSKEKEYISWNLLYFCNEHCLTLEEEYRFDVNGRKFRFDYCIPSLKIGIEYNGIMSTKSRHTTVTGYTQDMNKLNLAQSQGWRVLQFTPLNYRELITELNKLV